MVAGALWAAVRHSARVIAATNALGFAVTAVTQSHKITDLCGTASFALSAWATHSAAARCRPLQGVLPQAEAAVHASHAPAPAVLPAWREHPC